MARVVGSAAAMAELRSIPELKAMRDGASASEILPPSAPGRHFEYMDTDYAGMGSHGPMKRSTRLPGNISLPKFVLDSPFNRVMPAPGTPRGAFYRFHYAIDPNYFGGPVKRAYGGGGWSGRAFGWTKYGPLARAWYGTPAATKLAGYGLLGGSGAAESPLLSDETR
jgi:hypothetical protein